MFSWDVWWNGYFLVWSQERQSNWSRKSREKIFLEGISYQKFMKLIFLDIDWVIIPSGTIYCKESRVSPTCLRWFEAVVVETWAKIVISSTWRQNMDHVTELFKDSEIVRNNIIWRTPFLWGWRSTEINMFLIDFEKRGHTVENWLAIDDDVADMWYAQHHKKFVRTDTFVGFTGFHAKEVMCILNLQ